MDRASLGLCAVFSTVALAFRPSPGAEEAAPAVIEGAGLRVAVDPASGTLAVRERSGGFEWRQALAEPGAPKPRFRNLKAIGDPPSGLRFSLEAARGAPTLQVVLSLGPGERDLSVEVDTAERSSEIPGLPCLDPFVLDSKAAALVVADYADGHLYDLGAGALPRRWFTLSDIDMPWAGLCDLESGAGLALVVETPDDASIEVREVDVGGRKLLGPRVVFQPSRKQFRYPRRFFYHFSPRGGYVALAKRYREHARVEGLLVTLEEKARKNPAVARIFGAADVWGDASLSFAREAKAAGVEKMVIHGRSSPEEMEAVNALGYLTSEYDNYTDLLPLEPGKGVDSSHGRVPEDVVLQADGQRMKAWLTWDKKQYMKRCPALWVAAAREVIPKVLDRQPYLGRFIDVTTAEGLYECWDPAHPLTRSEKRACGEALLGYVRSLGLVVGGEHGRHWAVPHLDYIEGMMSGGSYSWPAGHLTRPKSKDQEFVGPWGNRYAKWEDYERWGIGHRNRVPLWDLVFHDCIVSTWYWGDSSDFLLEAAPEVTPKKDALNVLYGTIPILWANREGSWRKARDAFLRTCRATSKLHEAVATSEMLEHAFVTPDRDVQRTRFSCGTEVVANFGDREFEAEVGGTKRLLPKNGFLAKGPRIEESYALEGGKPVLRIRAGAYEFVEGE